MSRIAEFTPVRLRRHPRAVLAVAVVMSLAASPAAGARRNKRAPEHIEPGFSHLRSLDAFFELESSVEQVRVRSNDGAGRVNARQTNRSAATQGLLGLSFGGDLIHPYLLDYHGDVTIGLSEQRFREETLTYTDTDRATGFLSEFDLRADLLKMKPISGTVYGSRSEDRIGRLFLPSLRERRNSYGTAWVFKHDRIPMQLSFDHVDTVRRGNRDRLDDEDIDENHLRYTADWEISEYQKLKLDYEHSQIQEQYQGSDFDFDTRRDQVRLDYDLGFGGQHQHRFVTFLRVQEESGDLAQDIVEFGPQLILQHTPDLSTRYAYQFTRERFGAIDVDLHRGDFQIRHQFLKNLTTTFDAFGLEERTDHDVETSQGGASIAWQYTRKNPYGQLTAELRVAGDSERTRGNDGLRLALNESGTFRDPLPVFLTRPNVAPTSVVVTDLTGRIVYWPIFDYFLTRVRDRTALFRVPSGRIANGQTVLIDYRYRTPQQGRIDTTRVDFEIEQAFSWGLTPYYRLGYRNQELDTSSGFPFVADWTDHHRLGVTYRRPRWSLNAEYEIFDDSVDPYDGFHLGGTFQALRDEGNKPGRLDFTAEFSQYFFERGLDQREVSEINLGAQGGWQLNNHWSTSFAPTWRWEDDSIRGTTNGFDLESSLAYRLNNLTVELTVEYDLLRIAGSREDGASAWLRLRWNFEDLLGTE